MGKNYWCDFCQRSFVDILETRKKHIRSIQHQRLRKLHYDSFKDAASLLQEESTRHPCKRFFQTGQCDFGDLCKYSHTNIENLKQRAKQKKNSFEINTEGVNNWLGKWKQKKDFEQGQKQFQYKLPPGFPPMHQLPISLQPPLTDAQLDDVDWG